MKVKVVYNVNDTNGIHQGFDAEVKRFFISMGFRQTGTGTDVSSGERDLSYEIDTPSPDVLRDHPNG